MQPIDLEVGSFAHYPKQARSLAEQNVPVLRALPLTLLVLVLRELIVYDWHFPAEQHALKTQLDWLASMQPEERKRVLSGFLRLTLSEEIASTHWIDEPQKASEQMTAYLWSSHQMDEFRSVAAAYAEAWHAAVPDPLPMQARLCIVAFGKNLQAVDYSLFRKLRPHGTLYLNVSAEGAPETIRDIAASRMERNPVPYQHWLIDTNENTFGAISGYINISWSATEPLRKAVLQQISEHIRTTHQGPEELQSKLASLPGVDTGKPYGPDKQYGEDEVLIRFKTSLYTEGSGTQIFSTTFAQWAAREALRRAQPSTLLVRYSMRQRQLPMDELLTGAHPQVPDPAGSLIDADMGAYYTWINLQRLAGAQDAVFIAWSEAYHQAIALGPKHAKGSVVDKPTSMRELLAG